MKARRGAKVTRALVACWLGHQASAARPRQTPARLSTHGHRNKSRTSSRKLPSASRARGPLTYGGDEGGVEGVVGEAEEHAGLPHARVPDEQQLEQQVVRFLRH